jgi:hypothetical protein
MADGVSDADLALMLEGVARKLEDGNMTQDEAAGRLVRLLTVMDGVATHEGALGSRGRVSFGRSNEGVVGTAVFVEDSPAEWEGVAEAADE